MADIQHSTLNFEGGRLPSWTKPLLTEINGGIRGGRGHGHDRGRSRGRSRVRSTSDGDASHRTSKSSRSGDRTGIREPRRNLRPDKAERFALRSRALLIRPFVAGFEVTGDRKIVGVY